MSSIQNVAPLTFTGQNRDIVLNIRDVAKTYFTADGAYHALEPVTAKIHEGEFVSLVGPSGCGKTTMLKMCAGLLNPTQGSLHFRDTGSGVVPGSFGMVFQSPALLPWRTVLDNVLLPVEIRKLRKRDYLDRAMELLSFVNLAGAEKKYPGELSGGMQQRASIARSLILDPDILFMDEPFGALDAMTRDELNVELQRVQIEQNKTVVFVTHGISEAIFLSNRVVVFSAGPGRVIADIEIDLPRPRPLEIEHTPEFGVLESEIRGLLNHRPGQESESA